MIKQTLLAATALLFAGMTLAETGDELKMKDSEVPSFSTLDKDQSGSISREEARAYPDLEKIFSNVDRDRNGQLLAAEYRDAVARLKG